MAQKNTLKMTDKDIMTEIYHLVSHSKFEQAAKLIRLELGWGSGKIINKLKHFFNIKDSHKKRITLNTWLYLLNHNIIDHKYVLRHPLNFEIEYCTDIGELIKTLEFIDSNENLNKHALHLADLIADLLITSGEYIVKNSNNYPLNPINAQLWMDGTVIRAFINQLAVFYRKKQEDDKELQMLINYGRVTLSIMSHYENEVGPAMLAIGNWYIRHNKPEDASKYFIPVIKDFQRLMEDFNHSEMEDIPDEYYVSIDCLRQAYEGVLKTGLQTEFTDGIEKIAIITDILNKRN